MKERNRMNTTLESKQTQCSCGQFGDHRDQIKDYPVGSHVRAIVSLTVDGDLMPKVPQGAVGRVRDHCDNDGRACIMFSGNVHTFHYPKQCIEPLTEAEAALLKSEQAIVELSKQILELRTVIKTAHQQLCKAHDLKAPLFVDSARAMLGDVADW